MTTTNLSLSRRVYDVLKWNIETQRLPPGLILEVAGVADAFQLSRTPVSVALKALHEDKLVLERPRRGFVVGNGEPFRHDPQAAGLTIPAELLESFANRSWRSQFYPQVEREIAICLPFGPFAISASGLAKHKAVSRTIANETLVRLERLGLVRQERSRWFTESLTPARLREHYELRWLLEPEALRQASPFLDQTVLAETAGRAEQYHDRIDQLTIEDVDQIEEDLHTRIVLTCPNRQMAETIRRSQLPLMATTHSAQYGSDRSILELTISEHRRVLTALLKGDIEHAARALEEHLRRSHVTVRALLLSGALQWEPPPYMIPQRPASI
ncbi:GntR family transcriptional regulator [Mesorhizobium sp. M0701]|uniref:GntR family transcriptional regulator n=1 Tax=Mesorhizobium sp. M0701 TaxID=2956989 RepID=UPI003336B6EE